MQDIGFSCSIGHNHYDVAREIQSMRNQKQNFIDTVQKYREAGRTSHCMNEACLSKYLTAYRSWNDVGLRARLDVAFKMGGRIIVLQVLSRTKKWWMARLGSSWARKLLGTTTPT